MFRKRKFLILVFLSAFLSLPACGSGGTQEVTAIGEPPTSTNPSVELEESERNTVQLVSAESFDPCSDILALHAGTADPPRQHWFNHLTYQDYARYWIACVHGWGEAEWHCLVALNNHESGWNPLQWNRAGSGAYGIPQALPGYKMASHGDDWRTNGRTQIRWQARYIADHRSYGGKPSGTGCRGPY